jgi:Nickel responsive protein SCO4226-like
MPIFMIRRDLPGATQEDMDAAAFRAITCAFYFPGMKWHRSFWDQAAGVLHCVYEAKDADEIIAHSLRARIPCDDVRQVDAFGPEAYVGAEAPKEVSA